MEILNAKNLSFTYPDEDTPALSNVTFSVSEGEFVAVCGATGSGKSTLLSLLKREVAPMGKMTGEIFYRSTPTSSMSPRDLAFRIGYVTQRPEQQIVTDKVWHELSFALENMGLPSDEIRRRVAEVACFFGIEDLFDRRTDELSGGQKQLLNLAAVVATYPDILLLDEPTAQLDPIAASDFITMLKKLNSELSMTIIIADHRLEEIIPASDSLLVLGSGHIIAFGKTRAIASSLRSNPHMLTCMPAAVRIYSELANDDDEDKIECPLTVREGRDYILRCFRQDIKMRKMPEYTHKKSEALSFRNVYLRYSRDSEDVLRALSLTVYESELFCIVGGNGSGKTTALLAASGLRKFYAGNIKIFGRDIRSYKNGSLYSGCLVMLPQDVDTLFLCSTVEKELRDAGTDADSLPFKFPKAILDRHPYNISGGEKQLLGLAKLLATHPRLLLLDEPTKGLDAWYKTKIGNVLRSLTASGITVVIVTHDIEFAAAYADRCALFFRGSVVSSDTPQRFFAENSFYTTSAARMVRGIYDGAITADDVIALCRANGQRNENKQSALTGVT
ncbi:MAG: ATP-binding cassette domain-containing protein [Clostridiales bacterium]|jgi:energy-coupling factor transport system ATP-binding protein|nr:ATP-binding cassette domain-containing protein [Clostridiales bacterium]